MLKGHQSYNIPKSNKKVLRIISVFLVRLLKNCHLRLLDTPKNSFFSIALMLTFKNASIYPGGTQQIFIRGGSLDMELNDVYNFFKGYFSTE